MEKIEEREEVPQKIREIILSVIDRDEGEEIGNELFTNDSLITREKESEILSKAVNITSFFLNEGSSKASERTNSELVSGWGERRIRRESLKELSYYESIDSIYFREFEMSFSKLFDTIWVYNPLFFMIFSLTRQDSG